MDYIPHTYAIYLLASQTIELQSNTQDFPFFQIHHKTIDPVIVLVTIPYIL